MRSTAVASPKERFFITLHYPLDSIRFRPRYPTIYRNITVSTFLPHRQGMPDLSTTAGCLDEAGAGTECSEDVADVPAGPHMLIITAHVSVHKVAAIGDSRAC